MKFGKHTTKICLAVIAVFFLSTAVVSAQGSIFSIHDILWTFVNNVFGWMFAASGALLNAAINEYIIGFGNAFITGGIGAAVDTAWVIVRDIFNLTFIFGLIWIGFKMILNSDDANTRRWLVNLIMAALLVNFSLFITKFVVDFTNLLATQVVQAGFPNVSGATDVTSVFMTQMGATSVWDGDWINDAPEDNYMVIFGALLVFLIGAFVFLAGAIMIYVRFIALCLYMIFSPLMFLGWVFPNMSGVTSKYWRGFLGRAFFAPVYILMLYFSAAVMLTFGSLGGGSNFANAFGNGSAGWNASGTATLVPFILIIGFLIASIVVANRLGADGAGMTMNMMTSARNKVQNKVKQTTYRYAGGAARGAGRLAKTPYDYGKRRTSYALGSGLERQINRMQQSNSKALRAVARTTAVDSGARGAAQSLKSQKAGLFSQQTIEEQQKASNTINERADRMKKAKDNLMIATASEKDFQDLVAQKGGEEEAKKAQADAAAAFAAEVGKMSAEEVKSLPNATFKTKDLTEEQKKVKNTISAALNDEQIKALQESGQYSNDEIKGIKTARNEGTFSPLTDVLERSTATDEQLTATLDQLGRTVKSLSTDRLTGIKVENKDGETGTTLTDPRLAANLTDKQMDSIRDSGKVSTDDFEKIKKARKEGFKQIAEQGSLADASVAAAQTKEFKRKQRERLFQQSAQDAGQLPAEVYKSDNMVTFVTPQALQQRVRNGLSQADKNEIETKIKDYINSPAGQKDAKKWRKWTENTTEGANFDLGNNPPSNSNSQPAPTNPPAPQNPHNQFGSAAEAQRWADWNAQNNPNNNQS